MLFVKNKPKLKIQCVIFHGARSGADSDKCVLGAQKKTLILISRKSASLQDKETYAHLCTKEAGRHPPPAFQRTGPLDLVVQ
jgi:hypothetical protein